MGAYCFAIECAPSRVTNANRRSLASASSAADLRLSRQAATCRGSSRPVAAWLDSPRIPDTPRPLRHPQEAADPCLDFLARPAEAQAARGDEPVRVLAAGVRGVKEVESDRRGWRAASEQPRPGGEVGKVKERLGAAETNLPLCNSCATTGWSQCDIPDNSRPLRHP